MKTYRQNFKRYNFSINPPLVQSADVLFQTDIPFGGEETSEEFDAVMYLAAFEQNPHWYNHDGPPGCQGWSTVLESGNVEIVQYCHNSLYKKEDDLN